MYLVATREVPRGTRNLRTRDLVSLGVARHIERGRAEREEALVHAKRRFLGAALAVSLLVVMPTSASANGGSYLEFDRTHYLPGDPGVAISYVSVPPKKMSLFERGPFYLFAVPEGMLREGMPIPAAAIRLGTFTIRAEEDHAFELRAAFTAPRLDSGLYFMGFCNDPCTIAGFREPLVGSISIVATRREGALLTANATLRGKLFGARREARKAERRLEKAQGELETQLTFGAGERDRMSARIEMLETQLAAARARVADQAGRTPFDPWVVGAIVLVALVAAALALRRRHLMPAITDL
jgi:hypothetical protein